MQNYDEANYNNNLSSSVLKKTHTLIEKDKHLNSHYGVVLELGVGTMAHFPHVHHDYDEYIASDHDPNVIEFLEKRSWPEKVKILELSGSQLPFDNNSVDRVIATHVLEHVNNPVAVLEEWTRVLKPGGVTVSYTHLTLPTTPYV